MSRTAVCDVTVRSGVWSDLGSIALARPAAAATWIASAHAINSMTLPTTRV